MAGQFEGATENNRPIAVDEVGVRIDEHSGRDGAPRRTPSQNEYFVDGRVDATHELEPTKRAA